MRKIQYIIFLIVLGFAQIALANSNQLRIIINENDVDLEKRTLHFRLNKPISVAEIKVLNLEGEVLSERVRTFNAERPGTRLSIDWPQIPGDELNFKIELKVTDVNDYWVGFEIIHFYGMIPHEEVHFETGKHDILPSEAPKLDAVIPEIIEMVNKFQRFSPNMTYSLYIAGHTDTVGSKTANRQLSERRAMSIARYFLDNGLAKQKVSIFVRGFGQESLAVQTPDDTPEIRNRRADYIVSNFPPRIGGPGTWRPVQRK